MVDKTCEEIIKEMYNSRMESLKLINRIDDPKLPFKDLKQIMEDMGYDVWDMVYREKYIDGQLVKLIRDEDKLTDLKYQLI